MTHSELMMLVDQIFQEVRITLNTRSREHALEEDALAVFREAKRWGFEPLEMCRALVVLKIARMKNRFESGGDMHDTLIDLIGYIILYRILLSEKRLEEFEEGL